MTKFCRNTVYPERTRAPIPFKAVELKTFGGVKDGPEARKYTPSVFFPWAFGEDKSRICIDLNDQ